MHVSESDIARLIEGSLDEAAAERVREHIRSCGRCFEVYQDAALYARLFESGGTMFASTNDTVAMGIAVPPDARVAATDRGTRRRPSLIRRPAFRFAAACVVLLVAALVWLDVARRSGGYAPPPPVRAAVETASGWGPLVLPGGERRLDSPGTVRRSGAVPASDSLEYALDRLSARYRDGEGGGEVAYWLAAGTYATGRIDIARDITAEARERHPDDARIAVLEALIAYTDGDHDRSVQLLRRVVDADSTDAVALFDLAVVLAARGEEDEARTRLEQAARLASGTPLAARAREVLSDIEPRRRYHDH